jgi:hypothetical protein
MKQRHNLKKPWSWENDFLLHDNLIYIPENDALRLEML